jgi:glycosyltransferase involved in cell wall biosynthesis
MKIALVHDQLQEFGGAERVLVALKQIYPQADVFTSFYSPEKLGIHAHHFKGWNIIESGTAKIPFFRKLYSPLRFLTPLIWESLNFNEYDLVISSSGSYMCKGIVTRPETVHICYLHHPPRYLYYYPTAIEWQKYKLIKIYGNLINHGLRIWDYLSSQRVDHFIANSIETKKRIEKFYRMTADVIYPPVDIPTEEPDYNASENSYYITTSRLAKAKHVDLLIQVANKLKFKLKIIGEGREKENLQKLAGDNVEFLSHINDTEFANLYKHAKAYLFASVDDEFGIAPVEAMGHGLPVIALASGGLKETVISGKNGYLYEQLTDYSLTQAIQKLEALTPEQLIELKKTTRLEAKKYTFEQFKANIIKFVESKKIK